MCLPHVVMADTDVDMVPLATDTQSQTPPDSGLNTSPPSEPGLQETTPIHPTVQEMIVQASIRWGLPPSRMLRIARCESRLGTDPNAYNGRSGHYGVFQFSPRTWAYASVRAGYVGASPLNDYTNIEVAMWLMKNVGPSQWTCK